MSPRARRPFGSAGGVIAAGSLALFALGGCAKPAPPGAVTRLWVAGVTAPAFDPDGPAEPVRVSLEHLLSRGLLERDSSGVPRPAAAESLALSPDRRLLTIRIRDGLRYPDGTALTSEDFAAALRAGLTRSDHATRAWALAAVIGVDKVRPGRPLPPLGIETPDPRTLRLRLARPDSLLPAKLALPGVSTPWRHRDAPAWAEAGGIGPYRVLRESPGRELTLVRADSLAGAHATADTLRVRFVVGAPRARTLLRDGAPDLIWPLPPALLGQPLPPGYALARADASPPRRLLLVLRADVPPTTKLEARHALVHALNRGELLDALGARAKDAHGWLAGAGPFDFPRLDAAETREWLARGKLGASFHVTLAWDADRAGAEIARALQGQWARLGLYAELRPLRGTAALATPLAASGPQAELVEAQALLDGAEAEIAGLVMPLRGPAVGSFRTGWRTREFDAWTGIPDAARPLDAAGAQQRLAEDRIVLPVADLPWTWIARDGAGIVAIHPNRGPEFAQSNRATPVSR